MQTRAQNALEGLNTFSLRALRVTGYVYKRNKREFTVS
jgi:hypothetical protein